MSLTKRDLIRSVHNQVDDLTIPQVESVVNAALSIITLALSCDEDVLLSGFGKFETRTQPPLRKSNPRTGNVMEVPEKRTVKFFASPSLKERVNE